MNDSSRAGVLRFASWMHQVMSLDDARVIFDAWRMDYNHRRSHSLLGHLTPNEFVAHCQVEKTAEETVGSR